MAHNGAYMMHRRQRDCITSNGNGNCAIEKDSCTSVCVVCKSPETEMCCDGKNCKRRYHISCLDPPLKSVPSGLWFCILCMKKKIEFGVYAVSEGIDSVWDFKEGPRNENCYLVKCKDLAHVHNFWVPESHLIQESPELLSKFKTYQEKNIIRWRQEWTEPQQLLQKRLVMPVGIADELFKRLSDVPKFYYEWLVKWKGLGDEDATWEFEDAEFLRTPEAAALIKDYEVHHGRSLPTGSSLTRKIG